MIELTIPGRGVFKLYHLVFDVEGSLATDGRLLDDCVRPLTNIRDKLTVHMITVDSLHQQDLIDRRLNLQSVRISPSRDTSKSESKQKHNYVKQLGAEGVIAIGQGADDASMIKAAGLGICILSPEGTHVETLLAADIVMSDISKALELIENPARIVNTLRN